jgi:hypothetical protein
MLFLRLISTRILVVGIIVWLTACGGDDEAATSWYKDMDSDTFGDPATEVIGDQPDDSYVTNNTDCDDTRADINPNTTETADLVDNDCDGNIDNGFKYAFVTSTLHFGDFGGLAGADAICQDLADNASSTLPVGTYAAWLSTSIVDARFRVTDDQSNTNTYVRTDGVPVANGFGDIIDGALQSSISFDETGANIIGGVPDYFVWTGTDEFGLGESDMCTGDNWSIRAGFGDIGWAINSDRQWTSTATIWACTEQARLYCFQK